MKIKVKVIALLSLLCLCGRLPLPAQQMPPFFVFNNGIADEKRDTPEKQVQLLQSLGYEGMEKKGLEGFAETLAALDKHGLKMYTMYLNIDLDNKEQPYDKRLPEVFRMSGPLYSSVTLLEETAPVKLTA